MKHDMKSYITGYDLITQTGRDSNDTTSFNVKWRYKRICVVCGNMVELLITENNVLKEFITEIINSFGINFRNITKNDTSQSGLNNYDDSVYTNHDIIQNTVESDENSEHFESGRDDIVSENISRHAQNIDKQQWQEYRNEDSPTKTPVNSKVP